METKRRIVQYASACLVFCLIFGSIGQADDRARDRASLRYPAEPSPNSFAGTNTGGESQRHHLANRIGGIQATGAAP